MLFSQVKISEMIQYSKVSENAENKVYLIDFWATWCAPCIHVKKYLTTLQDQYSSDFYIVSLTEEPAKKIKQFLEKHPTKLAVAIDYEGETFKTNSIRTLPYAILINAKGKTLWEGHPADLKSSMIDRFLRQNKKKAAIDVVFETHEIEADQTINQYTPTQEFELIEVPEDNTSVLETTTFNGYQKIRGSLKEILSYMSKIYEGQIRIPDPLNKVYELYIKQGTATEKHGLQILMDTLNIVYEKEKRKGSIIELNLEDPTFWDTDQFDWGIGSPSFLIGDSEIEADNIGLENLSYLLSSVLEIPVVIIDSKNQYRESKHDWQIHYKYFDLMKSGLKDNYGIEAVKKESEYTIYTIIKKRL